MIKPIYLYDSTVLRTPAKEVVIMTSEIEQAIIDLYDTVKATNGLGLAAPQIGYSYSIFVLSNGKSQTCFINPVILKKSKETTEDIEGCLSFPGLGVIVPRYESILVEARDVDLVRREYELDGLLARIFQHEYDHLNGLFMHNRMSKWNKKDHSYVGKYIKRLIKGEMVPEEEANKTKGELLVPEPKYAYILDNGRVRKESEQPSSNLIITG